MCVCVSVIVFACVHDCVHTKDLYEKPELRIGQADLEGDTFYKNEQWVYNRLRVFMRFRTHLEF